MRERLIKALERFFEASDLMQRRTLISKRLDIAGPQLQDARVEIQSSNEIAPLSMSSGQPLQCLRMVRVLLEHEFINPGSLRDLTLAMKCEGVLKLIIG